MHVRKVLSVASSPKPLRTSYVQASKELFPFLLTAVETTLGKPWKPPDGMVIEPQLEGTQVPKSPLGGKLVIRGDDWDSYMYSHK